MIIKVLGTLFLKVVSLFRLIYNKSSLAVLLRKKNYSIKIGRDFVFNFHNSTIEIQDEAIVKVGDGLNFRGYCNVLVAKNANLTVGDSVFFNRYCSINCLYKISIDDYTIFGEGVKLYDHNYDYKSGGDKVRFAGYRKSEIAIGKNCWIGSNVTILNNVKIGDNVIIGANNLIHKSIPSNSIIKSKVDFIIENR